MTEPPPPAGQSLAERFSLPRIHWAWLVVLALVAVFVWAAAPVLWPFIAGAIMAYLLDPLAGRLERRGWPRWLAAAVVLAAFLAALIGVIVAAAPIVTRQLAQLIASLPRIVADVQPWINDWLHRIGAPDQTSLIATINARAIGWVTASAGALLAGGLAFVNVLSLLVVAPIVAFYLLRDWQALVARVDSWWPRQHLPTIRRLLGDSDKALSGFIRGQFLVCLALAVFYAIGWSVVGLDYAIVLGLLAGIFGFVPFIGVIFAVVLSLLVGVGQFGFDPLRLGLVAGVFFVGQMLESTVLTPNLIGNRIGLHPVWVLFAVFAGGQIAGITGVFLAVPVAAVAGVFMRWATTRYLGSRFYAAGRLSAPPEP